MNAKRPPGGETGGPTDQRRPSCGPVVMVTQATDGWSQEFGQPSNYSLDPVTLARHVRQLRRSGWQSWEVKVRFDLGRGEVA